MTRIHPDDIKAIAAEIAGMLGFVPAPRPENLTIGQQAIAMARRGDVEGSKALLRAHAKRRAA